MKNRNRRELAELKKRVAVAGLTGGIASGKTVATDALRAAGYRIIDADEVSRSFTAPGTDCEHELMRAFPDCTADGRLDRRALRILISADAKARKRLEAITHPHIIAEVRSLISSTPPPVILSAPLLFESGLASLCDVTVCVTASRRVRVERLTARDGVTKAAAHAIIDAQIPDTYRATLADFCLTSNAPLDEFKAETVALFDGIFKTR